MPPIPPLPGSSLRLLILSVLGPVLAGCVPDATGPAERWVGAAGGAVSMEGGAVSLSVPAGALVDDLWFTATAAHLVPPSEMLVTGSSYEVGPPGTSFLVPVTLTLAYDASKLPEDVGEGGLGVFRVVGGGWEIAANTSVNTRARTVSGDVTSLGRFGVMGLSVESVEVSPTSVTLEPGDSVRIEATPRASNGRPLSARPVSWSSSTPSVAAVSDSGWVRAVGEGSATITVGTAGQTATAEIEVSTPVSSVEVVPDVGGLSVDQTLQLEAFPKDAVGNSLQGRVVAWSSSDPSVATVTENGLVTAKAVGSATVTATVEGRSGTATLTVQASLTILTNSLVGGVEGAPYVQTLAAAGGNGTYAWSVTEGALPAGLELDPSTGVISGVPSAADTSLFTVQVESGGQTATRSISIGVAPIPVASVSVTPRESSLTFGDTLQLTAVARDGSGKILWGRTVAWGSGDETIATVSGSGLVTPVAAGSVIITANVEGYTDWSRVTVHESLVMSTDSLASGVIGAAYSDTLAAGGGNGWYSWSLEEDSLPAGLTLSAAQGVISGTPQAAGVISFTVTVVSGDGQTATKPLSITVYDALSITSGMLDDGVVGAAYTDTLKAEGGTGEYTWSMDADTLPEGLSLDAFTGVVSGVPSETGIHVFRVRVISGDGQTASELVLLRVDPEPVASVTVTPATGALIPGGSRILSATTKDASGNVLEGRAVTWGSSNPGVATVSGTGTVTGVSLGSAIITATSEGRSGNATVTVHGPLGVSTTSLAVGGVGSPYDQTLAAMGGDGTYAWSISVGTLPPGLSLAASTGVISGTPGSAGTWNFTVLVSSGDGQTATKQLSISVI